MRLFVAVNFDAKLQNQFFAYSQELARTLSRASLSEAVNLHLTLAFIGEQESSRRAADALSRVCFAPFTVRVDSPAYFSRRDGRLYYLPLSPAAPLAALSESVKRELSANGVPFDNSRFTPHVTLIRRAQSLEGEAAPKPSELANVEIPVSAFSLMRSESKGGRLIYTPVYTVKAQR